MTMRTRIGRKIDSQRLAQMVSSPGIDPRVWVSLCVVDKVVVDDDGVFADVHVMSTATTDDEGNVVAQLMTVRVAADYAGNGFGLFFPPLEGDEVLVVYPDGNPDHGGILAKRLWSASDPPPQVAKNNSADALLMIDKDRTLRLQVQGKGNVAIIADQGKVLLGAETGTIPVARKNDPVGHGTIAFTFSPAGPSLAILYTPGDGSTPQSLPVGSGTLTLKELIQAGSSHVEST